MGKVNLVLNLVLVVIVGFILSKQLAMEKKYKEITEPRHYYFATTEDGRLHSLMPLNQPGLSNEELEAWVEKALMQTLNFSNQAYRIGLESASRHYTKRGWNSFTIFLRDFNFIKKIEKARTTPDKVVTVNASFISPPKIVGKQIISQRYVWNVESQVLIELVGLDTKYKIDIKCQVVRVPSLEAEKGIGIEKFEVVELDDATP